MSKQREAPQLALEALEDYQTNGAPFFKCDFAVSAIREALAEPEQEPVAWMCADEDMTRKGYSRFSRNCEGDWSIPVYTAPPARKPLKDEEIYEFADTSLYQGGKNFGVLQFARAIERAHGIGD